MLRRNTKHPKNILIDIKCRTRIHRYNEEDAAEDLKYSIDSDTETIVNDSDTIPYQESGSETVTGGTIQRN